MGMLTDSSPFDWSDRVSEQEERVPASTIAPGSICEPGQGSSGALTPISDLKNALEEQRRHVELLRKKRAQLLEERERFIHALSEQDVVIHQLKSDLAQSDHHPSAE